MVLGVCVTATSSHTVHSISIVVFGPLHRKYSVSWNVTFHVIANVSSYTQPVSKKKEFTGKIEGPNIRSTLGIYIMHLETMQSSEIGTSDQQPTSHPQSNEPQCFGSRLQTNY